MIKRGKMLALAASLLSGAALFQGCSGFWGGIFRNGFVDNKWLDIATDILNEELFG